MAGVILAACAGLSALSTLPLTIATLRARRPALALAVVAGFAVLASGSAFVVMRILSTGGISTPDLRPWQIVGIATIALAFLVSSAIPLLLARRRGWRLRWGRRENMREASP